MSENYLTVKEVGKRLNLSPPTVRKYLGGFGLTPLKTRGKWLISTEDYYRLKQRLQSTGQD